jgi:UDP-N-acetylglucosamine--N-acetylmuramyl-(pentapeptide) pyrophosphoryl-undecaprenol N-acetylglucosamine transferase
MRGPAVKPIVIAAGGTGGHFFPAEALATALVARGHRVALMTDARAAAKLPESFRDREVHILGGAGVAGRGIARQAAAFAGLARGTLQARAILAQTGAAAVVGFGGYPVVAPVLATRLLRHRPPVILHDQNAVLGTANRTMARFATALALSFDRVSRVPPGAATVVTGNPVRREFADITTDRPTDGAIRLLVLGGSLGARVFSDVVPAALAELPADMRARVQVTQQCRAEDIARVTDAYAAAGITAELSTFFAGVPARMAAATLFIGRAGGSTVAELAASGTPAILVPLPIAVNDEQGANAQALVDAGAAWLVRQADFTAPALAARLAQLVAVPAALTQAGAAARGLARPDAAERLADLVLQHAHASRAESTSA